MSAHQPPSQSKPQFVDFLAPFCSGWIAHREHPEIAKDDGEAFIRLAREAFEHSGPMLAWKVATGEQLNEAETATIRRFREALR